MLRDSPGGGTSKGATVAVTTRGVPEQIIIFFQISSGTLRVVTATVAPFDVPPQGLSLNVKYCSTLVHFMLTAKFDCFLLTDPLPVKVAQHHNAPSSFW
jgi:hypothetical protein